MTTAASGGLICFSLDAPATERERTLGRLYLQAPEPAGSLRADMSRWDRYAQALLATNEFLFVD